MHKKNSLLLATLATVLVCFNSVSAEDLPAKCELDAETNSYKVVCEESLKKTGCPAAYPIKSADVGQNCKPSNNPEKPAIFCFSKELGYVPAKCINWDAKWVNSSEKSVGDGAISGLNPGERIENGEVVAAEESNEEPAEAKRIVKEGYDNAVPSAESFDESNYENSY